MTGPNLTVVGPYVRPTPRTSLEERIAFLGGFVVVGLCAVEWIRRRFS